MSILNQLNSKFDFYKNYTLDEQNNILKLLNIAFNNDELDYDPNIYENTYVLCFYYKTYLVGCVCATDNYELKKSMSDFVIQRDSLYIDYKKKGFFIYNLAVLKTMRKKNIGYNLIKVLTYYLQSNADYIHVQIKIDNIGSLKIFEKNNFSLEKKLNNGNYDFGVYIKQFNT